jgi:dihydroorotase
MNILSAAQHASFPLHICHLSSIDGMALLKNHPDHVSVGVTPHHLLFDNNSIPVKNPFFKVNPPIRSSFDRQALWEGVQNGHIDLLESDHAPHTLEEKEQDFDDAPCGLPGVETMLPLFLAKVKREELSFARLISLICEHPAKLMNIPKGSLKIGNDADFIIVNLKDIRSISSEKLHSKFEWTPYEGYSAIFPSDVFLRGERIITKGECVGYQGYGHKV